MAITARTKKLVDGPGVTSTVLVEFTDFLSATWGRMSPWGDVEVLVDNVPKTYTDNFIGFPKLARQFNPFKGGLDKIGNITLELNNTENLIKDVFSSRIENTEVKIYLLLSAGGVLNRSNAELRFHGIVDMYGVSWTEEKITIKISEIAQRYDKDILKTQLEKVNLPLLDESLEGKFLPMIGGDWAANARDSEDPTLPENEYLQHTVALNCSTPTYLVDTDTDKFLIADHPIKTTINELTPENTFLETILAEWPADEVRRPIGLVAHNNEHDQLLLGYNNSSELDSDNIMSFTMPRNTRTIQGFFRPKKDNLRDDNIVDPAFAFDDDFIIEGGLNAQTFNNYTGNSITTQWFSFGNILDSLEIDPHSSGAYIEVICEPGGTDGRFLLRTDGNGVVAANIAGQNIVFIGENGAVQTYRIAQDKLFHEVAEIATFEPTISQGNFRTVNLTLKHTREAGYQFRTQVVWTEVFHGGTAATQTVPPSTNARLGTMGFTEYEHVLMNAERFANWQFGVQGRGIKVKRVFLRLKDVFYKGGYIPPEPIRRYETIVTHQYDLTGGEIPGTRQEEIGEEISPEIYTRWFERKNEIESRSNASPLFCMVKGLTDDDTPNGTLVTTPVDFFRYIFEHRMGLFPGFETDIDSFATTATRRRSFVGSLLQDQWQQHLSITSQKKTHTALAEFAQEAGCLIYFNIDKYFTRDVDWQQFYSSRYPVQAQFSENEILSYSMDRQKQIYDKITLNYAYDHASGKFRRRLWADGASNTTNYYDESNPIWSNIEIDDYDVLGNSSVSILARLRSVWGAIYHETDETKNHPIEISLNTIQSVHTARRLFLSLINKYTIPRTQITFTVGASGIKAGLGDTIYLSHPDWHVDAIGNYLVYSVVEDMSRGEYTIKALNINFG